MIKKLKKFSIIYLLILNTGLLAPFYVYSAEPEIAVSTKRNMPYKMLDTTNSPHSAVTTKTKHSSLVKPDDARELSMFFKIGIALNIIMLVAYISWAVRQWRQSNKQED